MQIWNGNQYNKLQPNARHKTPVRSCLPLQYLLRAITFLDFVIYFRYGYAVCRTASYSANARHPQYYVSRAFAGFAIHLCGFYSYNCANFRAARSVPEMFVSKGDQWHQFRAWRKWPFWVFVDEILSMIRYLIWCIQHFKSTSGFSQKSSTPTFWVQLNALHSECKERAKNAKRAVRERSPKVIFLFDLRINKFFGNGPPTVLSWTFFHPNTPIV